MLPEDPVLRGRLLRAARMLVNWSLPRLASQAGVSGLAAGAVEAGHGGEPAVTAARLATVLEWAGVRFLGNGDGLGPGLRYSRPRGRHSRAPEAELPSGPRATAGNSGTLPADRAARAEGCLIRQRAVVARLAARGEDIAMAMSLLETMDRSAELLRQCGCNLAERDERPEHRLARAA